MHFIITVDTEADNQWARGQDLTLKNIPLLPRFQELCTKYGFPVTYLITHEVAADQSSVQVLKPYLDAGTAEIGSHLHSWSNPPYGTDIAWERKHHPFPHELSPEMLKAKLETLTWTITEKFGIRPVSYRSGRWGFDGKVAAELIAQGYLVDCSVTPKISWKKTKGDPNKNGGSDFRRAFLYPYYIDTTDVTKKGVSKLIEVPLSVLYTGLISSEKSALTRWFSLIPDSFIKKVFNKIFFRVKTLRIFHDTDHSDFVNMLRSAQKNDLPVLEFMIHSSELAPGCSPYNKTEEAVEHAYWLLEDMLSYFRDQGLKGVTLREYARIFESKQP